MRKYSAMYRRVLSIALLVLLQGLGLNLASQESKNTDEQATTDKTAVQAQYASLPLAFEPNQGQADGSAQFLVHHGQATTYFNGTTTTTKVGDDQITMSLDGTNTPDFTGTDQLESKTNYFIGNDQSKWHSDVPNYKNILAQNVYPGIDLKYYGTNSTLEHDFIVNPGADPKQIAFHFDGQQDLSLDNDGNLILKAGKSDLRLNAPTTYQTTIDSKHTVPSHFELQNNIVTVTLGADYDHSQPLVIDPVLIYSTYLGGSASDLGAGITVDPSGNAYVTGYTSSTNFPTSSPYQVSNAGGTDLFITKMNPTGSAILYSTYLGGTGSELPSSIAVDFAGNAYIASTTTSTNFPLSSPFQATYAGGAYDATVTKLNPSGSALVYSTYFGGSGSDRGQTLAVDPAGEVYLFGDTDSTNIVMASAYQASNAGTDDMFLTKFNAAGSALIFSTYLGGSSGEQGFGIALDASQNAYLTGYTFSTNYPTLSAYQSSHGGGLYDVIVTKFTNVGSLVYSTYLGGTGDEQGHGIAVDTAGNAYVTGFTDSTNFPTASPYQASKAGSNDMFITKLNSAGTGLVYSTYLGGTGSDLGGTIALTSDGSAVIAGATSSSNFPIANALQSTRDAGFDGFVTKLNSTGSALTYSTYFGGNGSDFITKVFVSLNNNVFIVGYGPSTNLQTKSPYQASNAGGDDVFVAQITENAVTVTGQIAPTLQFSIGSTTCSMGFFSDTQTQYCTHSMTAGSNATGGYVISYIPTTTLTSGANTITAMSSQAASVVGSEQFGMNLKANTSAGSFTSSNFGADPSGGSGTAMTGYQTSDLFKFSTGGANIAQTTGSSLNTTYTVSFITNITAISEAGTYTTPVTYNIVASY